MRVPARNRPLRGIAAGLAGVTAVTLALTPIREEFSPAAPTTLLVIPVVLAAVIGGWVAATTTAIVAAAALGFAFVPPLNSFHFHGDALAVPVFVVVAAVVGAVVASEVHRRRLAEEANRAALLEQVDRQRAALLRSVSHDLRTPLTAIRAAAADLRDGVVRDSGTRRELLALVADQADRLDRLVANLLDLSRIEAGALQPDLQSVAVDELVHERVAGLRRVLAPLEVRIDVPATLPAVAGDYSQLGQVVTNLLENAARHSPAGGLVGVSATTADGAVELVVTDEGTGVPSGAVEQLFEPFRTGPGSNSTGIGLAICKAVVDAHHGRIWFAERRPHGAAFHVALPVSHG